MLFIAFLIVSMQRYCTCVTILSMINQTAMTEKEFQNSGQNSSNVVQLCPKTYRQDVVIVYYY